MTAKYIGDENGNSAIHNENEKNAVLAGLKNGAAKIDEVKKSERIRKAPLPFTTSTLQQEAAKALNFQPRRPCALHSSYMKEWI